MKENVIDILLFIFDNYLSIEEAILNDETALTDQLEEAGFDLKEISQAFHWLDELALKNDSLMIQSASSKALRVYSKEEQAKLGVSSRGFLHELEQRNLLDTTTREIIIDTAMTIETNRLSLSQFKRIVGLVMLNRAQPEEMGLWLQVTDDEKNVLH